MLGAAFSSTAKLQRQHRVPGHPSLSFPDVKSLRDMGTFITTKEPTLVRDNQPTCAAYSDSTSFSLVSFGFQERIQDMVLPFSPWRLPSLLRSMAVFQTFLAPDDLDSFEEHQSGILESAHPTPAWETELSPDVFPVIRHGLWTWGPVGGKPQR